MMLWKTFFSDMVHSSPLTLRLCPSIAPSTTNRAGAAGESRGMVEQAGLGDPGWGRSEEEPWRSIHSTHWTQTSSAMTAAILRSERDAERLVAVRLDRAARSRPRPTSRRGARATRFRGRRSPCCGTAPTTRPGRRVVDLTGDAGRVLDARPGRDAELHRRRVPRGRRGDARAPRRGRGAGRARDHRPVPGADRRVDLRQGADAGEVRATGGWAGATSGAARPPTATPTPTRSPGSR